MPGHTLVIDGVTYKLSLLPSGVVRGGKLTLYGNGVVVDPLALIDEIAQLKKQGVAVTPDNLRIAENAPLILPLHRELEAVREADNSSTRIGTTKRGIGPAYEDKVGRRAIRFMDLADLPALTPKIERLLAHHNALRRGLVKGKLDGAMIYDYLAGIAPQVLPFMDSVWLLLDAKRREGKRILFEGAQGALLDIDHGTYPYVTSSNTVAAQAATGSGLGPNAIDYVLGICKAYTTRVGEGPFPTDQMHNEIGKTLGERGRESVSPAGAPLRMVRCGAGAPDRARFRKSMVSRSPSSIFSTASTRSRSAWAIVSTAARSIIFPPASARRLGSSRSTRPSRDGRSRRRARARGRNCRRRP